MKKLLNFKGLLLCFAMLFATNYKAINQPTDVVQTATTMVKNASTDVKGAVSTVYSDSKDLAKYTGNVLEKTATRLDTILSKGYVQFAKGAGHTFQVLKTQQLVKSIHHLFYYILGIITMFLFFNNLKKVNFNTGENGLKTALIAVFALILWTMNVHNFMEMWTGFINPEYGAYIDIIEFYKTGIK